MTASEPMTSPAVSQDQGCRPLSDRWPRHRVEVRYMNGDGSHGLDIYAVDNVQCQMFPDGRAHLRFTGGTDQANRPIAWAQYAQSVRVIVLPGVGDVVDLPPPPLVMLP